MEKFFDKKKIFLPIFFLLLLIQLILGFLIPAGGHTGTGHGWLSLSELISHGRSPLEGSDVSLIDKVLPFFSNYTLVADGGVYVLLAKNFPGFYYQDNLFLSRPLYSFSVAVLAYLPHLIYNSYAVYFIVAILFNFILAFLTLVLFYDLIKKIISSRVAFFACLLFIFSPIVRAEIIQPEPGIYGAFLIVFNLWLLFNYLKNPSLKKLVIFSLISGILLLGKFFVAISVLIFLLAICFKRLKEGFLFSIIHLIPLFFWYIFVSFVLKLEFFDPSVGNFGSGVWLFEIFSWPWQKTSAVLIDVLPKFLLGTIYGFFLLPVIFALIGFKKFALANKELIVGVFVLSFVILMFVANLYYPYYAFLMFPLVLPLAILGIDRIGNFLQKYKIWYAKLFYLIVIVLFLFFSYANIYDFYQYWKI